MAVPVIFLSANPADLRSHRVRVRKQLEAAGLRVEELDSQVGKHWNATRTAMREKLKVCDFMVHLVGICHGAEPKWKPAGAPQRSFAQMEYHMACEMQMPCHLLLFSQAFPYDPHTSECMEARTLQQQHRAHIAGYVSRSESIHDLDDLKLRVNVIIDIIKPRPKPKPVPPAPKPAPAATVQAPQPGYPAMADSDVPAQYIQGPHPGFLMPQGAHAMLASAVPLQGVAYPLPDGQPMRQGHGTRVDGREHSPPARPSSWLVTWALRLPLVIMLLLGTYHILDTYGVLRGRTRVALHSPDAPLSGMTAEEIAAENEDTLVDTVETRRLAREVVQLSTQQGGLRDQYDARTKNELAEVAVATRHNRSVRALRGELKDWAQGTLSAGDTSSLNRGIASYLQGNYKLASREAWQFATDAEASRPPQHARALSGWLLQGHSHLQLIELAPALAAYRRALIHTSQESAPLIWCDIALMEAVTLHQLGRWNEAMPVFGEVIRVRSLHLSPDSPEIAAAKSGLAQSYLAMNQPQAAESLLRECLAMAETRYGPNHAEVAAALGALGEVLRAGGEVEEAEKLLNRAIAIQEKATPKDEPGVARHLSILARLRADMGQASEAETLCKRALDTNERNFGPDHPRVARELANLALILAGTHEHARAIDLQRRSLSINEKYFGSQHPEVATALNNLAGLLQAGETSTEAEPMFRRALSIDESVFGPEHPNLLRDLRNLGAFLKGNGRSGEALPWYRRALAIAELNLGKDHPDVGVILRGLALIMCEKGQYAEAETLCIRAMTIAEQSLVPDHPEVAQCAKDLAFCLCAGGKLAEADPLYMKALAIDEKNLGSDHNVVFWDVKNLAALHRDLGDRRRALPYFRRAYAMARRNFGVEHPRTIVEQDNLACMLRDTKNYDDAELLFRDVLAAREKHLAPNDPVLAIDISDLAGVLVLKGRHAEAEPMYRRVLEMLAGVTRKEGKAHPLLEDARQNYRSDLRRLGMNDDQIAERMRQVESGEAVQDLAAADSKG